MELPEESGIHVESAPQSCAIYCLAKVCGNVAATTGEGKIRRINLTATLRSA
jgi:hypothetical protein